MYPELLRDGCHGTICQQLAWARAIKKAFQADESRLVLIPNFIDKSVSSNLPIIPKLILLSDHHDGHAYLGIDFNFMNEGEGNSIFNELIALKWDQPKRKNGSLLTRKVLWFSDTKYAYGGIEHNPCSTWPPILNVLKDKLNSMFGSNINSVLLNLYENKNHCVNFHSDNEKIFGNEPVIFSLSFGGERTFVLAKKSNANMNNSSSIHIPMNSGTLIVMAGLTQKYWVHMVKKPNGPFIERINVTFREVKPL